MGGKTMRYAVIGGGSGGKAVSAYLREMGHEVAIYCRDGGHAAALSRDGITATGAVEGRFPVTATDRLAQAVRGAGAVLVQTLATGHAPVAQALRGLLEPGQIILIFNGSWGAAEFSAILGDEAREKNVRVCETSAQLFLCSSPEECSVHIKTIKKSVAMACAAPAQTPGALAELATVFPQLTAGSNVLDTSLNSSNPVVHGPIALFNITRLENGEDYTLFGTALPRKTVEYIEKIDAERRAVIQAMGVEAVPVLDILNSFWPEKRDSVFSALKDNPSYQVSRGPKTLAHRYLNEDMPYGLAPIARLGRRYGVDTPYLDSLLRVLGLYLGRDYFQEGPAVEAMDLGPLISEL